MAAIGPDSWIYAPSHLRRGVQGLGSAGGSLALASCLHPSLLDMGLSRSCLRGSVHMVLKELDFQTAAVAVDSGGRKGKKGYVVYA